MGDGRANAHTDLSTTLYADRSLSASLGSHFQIRVGVWARVGVRVRVRVTVTVRVTVRDRVFKVRVRVRSEGIE